MTYERNFNDWRKDPEKAARLYRFDEKLKQKKDTEDRSVKKLVGNILTDRKWWSQEPEKAHSTFNEDLLKRTGLMLKGRRGVKPHPRKQEWFFDQFFDEEENYHVAGLYSDKASLDVEKEVEQRAYRLLEGVERGENEEDSLKEAFDLLDSFNYGRTVDEFQERYKTSYLDEDGPDLVIDQVASDLLSRLDRSSKAFFQMYIAPKSNRPGESFRTETVAETYSPGTTTPRTQDAYIEDGLEAFRERLEDGEFQQAENIGCRFNLPASRMWSY